MSKYASIKRRTKDAKAPCIATLIHNARLEKNIKYLLPKHLRLSNYHLLSISNATKTFNTWSKENEDRYQEVNNRKLRSDAHRLESLLIILSEEQVNKCNPNEIWEKAKLFNTWFEIKYQTKTRTMDWHRDEGHSDEDKNNGHKLETRNNHIHLEFDNVNKQGKMVRRLFSKGDLKIFQDKIAEIYAPLGFVRGKDTAKKHRNDKPKRGIGQEAFRSKKKAESKEQNIKKEMELISQDLKKWEAKEPHYTKLIEIQKQLQQELLEQKINYDEVIKKIKDESQKIIDGLKIKAVEHNKVMGEKDDRIESLTRRTEELKKDVFSDKWTHKAWNGKKYKSKNINVVKRLEDERLEQKIQMETLEKQNSALTISLEQKNTQIVLSSSILEENQEKIKLLDKQVQEFKAKEAEKIEVIKKVPRALTQEEIMQSEIETEQGLIGVGDFIDKQKKIIVEKNSTIKELNDLAYTGNTYQNSDKLFPYKQRSKNQEKEIITLKEQHENLKKELENAPSIESVNQYKMEIEYLTEENIRLHELAYFDDLAYDNEIQEPYFIERSYKEEVSMLKNNNLKLENTVSNVAKYLHLPINKVVELFENEVPETSQVSLAENVKEKETLNAPSESVRNSM